MKKVLATVAALGLVLGVTANALALDQPGRASESEATTAPRVPEPTAPGVALWSVAGQWVLAGALVSNGLGNAGDANVWGNQAVPELGLDLKEGTDAFYIRSFKILPVLQVNDKIAMKGEIRIEDRNVAGLDGKSAEGANGALEDNGRNADFKHVYMEWVSPWGKTRFGRTPAGAWAGGFMNTTGQGDRFMWWLNMLPENWGSLLFIQKITERDVASSASDLDSDGYYVDLSYKADFGKTIGAIWATRSGNAVDAGGDKLQTYQARLYGNYNFNALNIEYEVNWNFGQSSQLDANGNFQDDKGLGTAVSAGYQMQDWNFGGLFFYMSGDSDPSDGDKKNMLTRAGTGHDWNPYQIMTGDYMGILNTDNPNRVPGSWNANSLLVLDDGFSSGVWSLGANVKFNMSPALQLTGELGYFAANKTISGINQDKELGWEVGIGMGYKIMDNLTYNAHFSYLATGDYFKAGDLNLNTENVYLLAHALSMKF